MVGAERDVQSLGPAWWCWSTEEPRLLQQKVIGAQMARQRSPSQICLVTNLTYNATPALLMDVEADARGVATEATETKSRQSTALSPLPPPDPPSSGPPLALEHPFPWY